jgi:hypothetical protein
VSSKSVGCNDHKGQNCHIQNLPVTGLVQQSVTILYETNIVSFQIIL